jgi:hypothetical protein
MMDEKKLLELKGQVEAAKSSVSELTGQKTALMKQLLNDWKCKTIEQAEEKLKSMQTELTTLGNSIKNGIDELEKKYGVK